jgi:hypothetical protein
MTVEQQFKIRQIEDTLKSDGVRKEDMIDVFLMLQEQAFVLGNNISQLVKQWPLPQATTQEET